LSPQTGALAPAPGVRKPLDPVGKQPSLEASCVALSCCVLNPESALKTEILEDLVEFSLHTSGQIGVQDDREFDADLQVST